MKRFSTTLKNNQIDSLAIGGFDGLHLAHQKLISHLTPNGALMIVDNKNASLTPKTERCRYLNCACIFLTFSKIKDLSAKKFVEFLHKEFKNLKKIVVGYDFRFGKDALGDTKMLQELFDGEVVVVEEVLINQISIHSRVIRTLLKEGDIKKANLFLGREYEIRGDVIKGQGIGKKELYATLNLEVKEFLIPKEGVYATFTIVGDKKYPSASFIGKRLSTDESFSIETHILDKDFSLSPKEARIVFIDFIRENKKFKELSLLKEQISKDLEQITTKLQQVLL
jgi:riboflavin kinase/FMN adenylyltransferase